MITKDFMIPHVPNAFTNNYNSPSKCVYFLLSSDLHVLVTAIYMFVDMVLKQLGDYFNYIQLEGVILLQASFHFNGCYIIYMVKHLDMGYYKQGIE